MSATGAVGILGALGILWLLAVSPFACRTTPVAAAVDHCPMGGEHDPGDSDRPCPRCGASPR